jgi:hypothetical protein
MGSLDPNVHNPLSQAEGSAWKKYFYNAELQKEIMQDINRTFPEYPFFRDQLVQEMMLRILFLWSFENEDLKYKQGMHELLAPIIFLAYSEYYEDDILSGANSPFVSTCFDRRHMEADCFSLFDRMMEVCGDFFALKTRVKKSKDPKKTAGSSKSGGRRGGKKTASTTEALPDASSLFGGGDEGGFDNSDIMSPMLMKCMNVHDVVLRQRDPEVYRHIKGMEIEPQIFLMKWIRLMLGREFHLEDVMILWDAIFAHSPTDFVLLDFICVAMIIYIRGDLLSKSYGEALRRLMKYPPVEDVTVFVHSAIDLTLPPKEKEKEKDKEPVESGGSGKRVPKSKKAPPPPPPGKKQPGPHLAEGEQLTTGGSAASSPPPPIPAKPSSSKPQPPPSAEQLALTAMKKTQEHMGERLNEVVLSLEMQLRLPPAERNEDYLLLEAAQLKQIRDVLMGNLSERSFSIPRLLHVHRTGESGLAPEQPARESEREEEPAAKVPAGEEEQKSATHAIPEQPLEAEKSTSEGSAEKKKKGKGEGQPMFSFAAFAEQGNIPARLVESDEEEAAAATTAATTAVPDDAMDISLDAKPVPSNVIIPQAVAPSSRTGQSREGSQNQSSSSVDMLSFTPAPVPAWQTSPTDPPANNLDFLSEDGPKDQEDSLFGTGASSKGSSTNKGGREKRKPRSKASVDTKKDVDPSKLFDELFSS